MVFSVFQRDVRLNSDKVPRPVMINPTSIVKGVGACKRALYNIYGRLNKSKKQVVLSQWEISSLCIKVLKTIRIGIKTIKDNEILSDVHNS
jgi:hypothetical protein